MSQKCNCDKPGWFTLIFAMLLAQSCGVGASREHTDKEVGRVHSYAFDLEARIRKLEEAKDKDDAQDHDNR